MKKILFLAILGCMTSSFAIEPPSKLSWQFLDNPPTQEVLECTDPCPMDFDDSGSVNNSDLVYFLAFYGTETIEGCEIGDFDEDGFVTVDDLRTQVSAWGYACE